MSTKPQDARHVPLSDVDRLRQDAAHAAEVRALTTHPDVVALRTERFRSQVDALMWAGLLLGLAFTMVNVQQFAAAGAAVWSLAWLAAWLLDPMVSLVLVAVLRAEQITARYQVTTGPWVRRTKWFAFLATYTMNTWQSWADLNAAGILAHSVPPFAVICVAETGPHLRDRLTEAVIRAGRPLNAPLNAPLTGPVNVQPHPGEPFTRVPVNATVNGPSNGSVNGLETAGTPSGEHRSPRSRTARKSGKARRVPLAENLAMARAAYRPGVLVTPAWVRQVIPDCSRGSSQKVSDALNAELAAHTNPAVTTSSTVASTHAGTSDQHVSPERAA